MRESEIQGYWDEQFTLLGGICRKIKGEVVNGMPDYLNAFNGSVFMIEFKAPGEKPKPHQLHEHGLWRDERVPVFVIDSKDKVNALIASLLKRRPLPLQ